MKGQAAARSSAAMWLSTAVSGAVPAHAQLDDDGPGVPGSECRSSEQLFGEVRTRCERTLPHNRPQIAQVAQLGRAA